MGPCTTPASSDEAGAPIVRARGGRPAPPAPDDPATTSAATHGDPERRAGGPAIGTPRGPDEATLVRRAQGGSADAAGALFERHWDRAWRTALGITGRPESADDVAQAAFERAFGALGSFDARRPFGPWLHRIVVNGALDLLRRERHLVLVADPPEGSSEPPSPPGDRLALAALARLTPERRVVVVLRHLLDYRPHEIAPILEIPVGTVNSRLARGMDELRTMLGERRD
jgi:RNA polymerase sigma-70 factor, ECF subfamily